MMPTPPAHRLFVVAPTFDHFKAWCHDRNLSPRDPLLIDVLPSDWDRTIRGRSGFRYVVADWMPSEPRMHGLWPQLEIRGTEMTPAELEVWIEQRKAGVA